MQEASSTSNLPSSQPPSQIQQDIANDSNNLQNIINNIAPFQSKSSLLSLDNGQK